MNPQDQDIDQLPKCPITNEIMKDPVLTQCGNTYEREAIEEWLNTKCEEPLTRKFLTKDMLVPNRALKEMYEKYISKQSIDDDDDTIYPFESTKNPLELQLTKKFNPDTNTTDVMVTINSPKIEIIDEDMHDIVLCLDTSGSMGISADNKENENSGLSRLDILKHGVKTIINTSTTKNRISIVTFSSEGLIRCPLISVNSDGKQRLLNILDIITPDGMTNLYDGIIKSWSVIESRDRTNIKSSIIVFTDGEPNSNPPRGYIPQLRLIKEQNKGKYQCDINIYTFGTQVNSQLADDISKETGGSYGYMPDASFIGDLLVHKLAAIRSCRAKNSLLKIDFGNAINLSVIDSLDHIKISNTIIQINVGDILYGQNKNFVISVSTQPNTELTDVFAILSYNENNSLFPLEIKVCDFCQLNDSNIYYNKIRQELVNIISLMINYCDSNDYSSANHQIVNFIFDLNGDDRLVKMKEDINGQIKLAINTKYYGSWGKHYLLSIRRAYQLEVTNNFKDTGIQHFGSELFNKIVDYADNIFTKMPPPKPSNQQMVVRALPQYTAPVSMVTYSSRYNNSCFHGDSLVTMGDNTTKKVSELIKGDIILLPNGQTDIIECIIKTTISSDNNLVIINENLHITPYHPVRINDVWIFPKDLSTKKSELYCDSIYSFVLENRGMGQGMIIGNIECATLGHGLSDSVISHDFFGTEKVINNLKLSNEYLNGTVIIKENSLIRDLITDQVCGIKL